MRHTIGLLRPRRPTTPLANLRVRCDLTLSAPAPPAPPPSNWNTPTTLPSAQAIHWAIVLNVVVMGMGGHNIGEKKKELLSDMETALTIFFTVEATLKITVLGARRYFKSR